jgi:hypothetical protein
MKTRGLRIAVIGQLGPEPGTSQKQVHLSKMKITLKNKTGTRIEAQNNSGLYLVTLESPITQQIAALVITCTAKYM